VATATQLVEELSRHTPADVRQLAVNPNRGEDYKRRRLRSLIKPAFPRPLRTELERACRIALLETEESVPVEIIYDRIVRRGSVMLLSYKRPFRAITLAMRALVGLGEASLLRTGSQRRWQRTGSLTSCERKSRI
jgi:hypothetical protein